MSGKDEVQLSIFNYPSLTWADVGAIGWLVDGAAIVNQMPLCHGRRTDRTARAMVRICKEESFHQRQGFDLIMQTLAAGSVANRRRMAQDALEPLVVADADDVRSVTMQGFGTQPAQSMAVEDQDRQSNDELRQKFVDQTVPQAEYLGLTVPDPDLKWNEERGHYDFTQPDWSEFFNVVKGNGPCNADRMEARQKAWEDGAWVRDGLLAHARKKAAGRVAAE